MSVGFHPSTRPKRKFPLAGELPPNLQHLQHFGDGSNLIGLGIYLQKNGRGGLLRYQSVQEKWAGYCAKAGISCTIHELRHAHATELVNEGVSLLRSCTNQDKPLRRESLV